MKKRIVVFGVLAIFSLVPLLDNITPQATIIEPAKKNTETLPVNSSYASSTISHFVVESVDELYMVNKNLYNRYDFPYVEGTVWAYGKNKKVNAGKIVENEGKFLYVPSSLVKANFNQINLGDK